MAPAISLEAAAEQSYQDLTTWWLNDTLKTKVTAFVVAVLPIFQDENANSRPIANWMCILNTIAVNMSISASFPPLDTKFSQSSLSAAVQTVYKSCWLGEYLHTTTPKLVTDAQYTAMLAAYNANLAS